MTNQIADLMDSPWLAEEVDEEEAERLVLRCKTDGDLVDLLLRLLRSHPELESVCREVAKARLLLQGKGADHARSTPRPD
jgi:hypothetical protein